MIRETQEEISKKKKSSKFNILITGGLNLGSFSNSKYLVTDSFTNLRNVLKLARAKKIDFIILTGNTLNQKYPSKIVMQEAKETIKNGTGRVKEDNLKKVGEFDYLLPGGKDGHFQGDTKFRIPIFCIRGPNEVSICYGLEDFGKLDGINDLSEFDFVLKNEEFPKDFESSENEKIIKPVIFVKNKTCLMIYFLDYIEDEVLKRKIKEGKLKFQKTSEKQKNKKFSKVFKFLVLRQSPLFDKKHKKIFENEKICSTLFPDNFFDLMIWSHSNFKTTELVEIGMQKILKISDLSRTQSLSLYNQKYKYLGLLTVQKEKMKTRSCLMDCMRPIIRRKVLLKNNVQSSLLKIERDLMLKISSHYKQDQEGQEDLIKKPILALKILNYCDPKQIKIWEKKFKELAEDLIANPK